MTSQLESSAAANPTEIGPQKETVLVHVPRVTARTFAGPASPQNKGALDWAGHGLLAYGSNYIVVVVDTLNVQVVQTLDRHKSMVKKVLWGRDYLSQDKPTLYPPRLYGSVDLVSADATGHIIVWDVFTGKPLSVLQEGTKPVQQLAWVNDWDGNNHVLAALHPPYSLILWDTRIGTKLWKKTYTEPLLSFCFDPFHPSKMAFHCSDCILLVEDFSVPRIPSSNGRKFYVSTVSAKADDKFGLRRIVKDLVIGESKPKGDDGGIVHECLDVSFHRALRHHLVLLYSREVLILDLHIKQTVGVVPIGDKLSSPFLQVISCKQRDVIYCLHDNGSVSVRIRKRPMSVAPPSLSVSSLDLNSESQLELAYEHRSSSETMRQSRGLQILGMVVNPVCERRIAVYLNSGKIVFLELLAIDDSNGNNQLPLNKDGTVLVPYRDRLSEILPPLISELNDPLPPLKLFVAGFLPCVSAPLCCLRMCPAITTRNWQSYTPLLAGGSIGGLVQIYNVATGEIEKELIIHSYTVRGIEWTGLKSFLSYAFPTTTASFVRNELCLTDVQTGESESLRTDRGEEPPIDILRVSPQKQYFILVLSGGPVELWDLKTKHVLRTLPRKFPVITALEWSPAHNAKSLRRRQSSKEDCLLEAVSPTPPLERLESSDRIGAKEFFVFSDNVSQLYHFTVEGHQLKDGVRIPPESGAGTVTAIAFKAEQIVQGDSDGLLSVWDLRLQQARRHSTSRGYIKKMRFAPGKGNLKLLVLYNDGVDIIDLKGSGSLFERSAQLKCPRDMVKVIDIDWSSSDKPVLVTADGCLRIMDLELTTSSSSIMDYEFVAPVSCPALFPTEVAFKLRERLCWQPADTPYTLDLKEEHGFTPGQLARIQEALSMVDPGLISNLQTPTLGTAQRCLLVARLFGDSVEIDFWTVALYYLQVSKGKIGLENSDENGSESPTSSPCSLDCQKTNQNPDLEVLDTCFDVLQDAYSYQRMQFDRVALHESKRDDYQHTKRVIQQLLLLGQSDRAVQLLLETDLSNSEYYTDAIKACLVATVRDTGAAQSTVKLVATNLIASGSIWDGVQLLCLIGKGLDACRYLESYGHWGAATWLARAVLPSSDACEVIRKWADHLSLTGHKEKALLVLMSLEKWTAVYSQLSVIDPRRASLLAQSFQDFGISS